MLLFCKIYEVFQGWCLIGFSLFIIVAVEIVFAMVKIFTPMNS